jgi:hypothetical protein
MYRILAGLVGVVFATVTFAGTAAAQSPATLTGETLVGAITSWSSSCSTPFSGGTANYTAAGRLRGRTPGRSPSPER